MTDADPVHRLDAQAALDRLRTAVLSMTPESLLVEPCVVKKMMSSLSFLLRCLLYYFHARIFNFLPSKFSIQYV